VLETGAVGVVLGKAGAGAGCASGCGWLTGGGAATLGAQADTSSDPSKARCFNPKPGREGRRNTAKPTDMLEPPRKIRSLRKFNDKA
jgi:hypothetical protein